MIYIGFGARKNYPSKTIFVKENMTTTYYIAKMEHQNCSSILQSSLYNQANKQVTNLLPVTE